MNLCEYMIKDAKSSNTTDIKKVGSESNVEKKISRNEKKKQLSDLKFSYDKKYNAFCLSISGYSIDKLEAMLNKKKEELKSAKEKKNESKTHFDRDSAQIEIDFLTKACHKCGDMIRKKKSYHTY